MAASSQLPTQPAQPATTAPVIEEAPGWQLPAGLRALRHYNYRLFFIGQLISLTGTWMQSVAQGWLVLRLTDSPGWLGTVAAIMSLPILLFSLQAGTIIDRVSKHRLLVLTQVAAMVPTLALAILTLSGMVQLWHVLVSAFLLGLVNAFDAPARQSFTVDMVGREDLLNAIALNSSIFNAARTMGPAIAGIIVALIGEGPAFLFNGLSFGAVIIGLLLMRLPPYVPPAGGKRRGQVAEGLHYIAGEPLVRALLIQVGVISFFGFVQIPLLPVFARDVMGLGADGLGWLSAASGTGALIAALILAQFGDKLPRGRLVAITALLYPVFLISFTLTRSLLPGMLCLALAGWAGVTTMALTNTLIQSIVPDTLRGRVMSVFTLSLMGLSPMGGMLAGTIAQAVGNVPLVVAASAGIAWIITFASTLASPRIRRL